MKGERGKVLQKTLYLQNRRFIPQDSLLRQDSAHFECEEHRQSPPKPDIETVKNDRRKYEDAPNAAQRSSLARESGVHGHYALEKVLETSMIPDVCQPDPMHTLKSKYSNFTLLLNCLGLSNSKCEHHQYTTIYTKAFRQARFIVPPFSVYLLKRYLFVTSKTFDGKIKTMDQ